MDACVIQQAAAIPLKDGQVCLVLSGSGKQWIVPKGHVELHEAPAETAQREAWEEAGGLGKGGPEPLGDYHYEKCGRQYQVTVFLMQVHKAMENWPECGRRLRRWLPPSQATGAVQHPRLRELVDLALISDARQAESVGERIESR